MFRKLFFKQMAVALFVISMVAGNACAQEELTDQQKKDLLKDFYRDFASRIEFSMDADRPMKLVEEPVMSWTGQERSDFTSGDVFVWTREGRAEMIGCVGSLPFRDDRRSVFQEFHSLATSPIAETVLEVEGPWGPKEPGVAMKTVDTKTKPLASEKLRLAQMRRVAGEFNAFMQPPDKPIDERLRLMTQPLYRFDTKELAKSKSNVVDGAIFAYVWSIGTDPELLLLLECHRDGDQLVWKYAPVRFTYRVVRLEHKGKEVWAARRDAGNRNSAYRTTSGGVHSYTQMKSALAKSSSNAAE